MSHITSKDYIVITPTKVAVGGQETAKFLGQEIDLVKELPGMFEHIQDKTYKETRRIKNGVFNRLRCT